MKKRGQVTTFMIIGVIVLVVVVILFSFKNSIYESLWGEQATKSILSTKMESINRHIQNCIEEETNPALITLGKQGGTFNPINYRTYKGERISYLCFQIPDTEPRQCENQMLIRTQLENELYKHLFERINSCIDIESFRSDRQYKISSGEFNFGIKINDKNILFDINYPITLERKDIEVSVSDFSHQMNVPLGLIQTAVKDILDYESNFGTFSPVDYTVLSKNEIIIYYLKPYPDKIYKVKQRDSDYEFQFAIKGINEH